MVVKTQKKILEIYDRKELINREASISISRFPQNTKKP